MRTFFPGQHIFDLGFLLILIAYILAGTAAVPFHGDEATQIYMSRDYAYQFLQGDLELVRYHEPPISAQEQQLRLLNGTLNKYAIGLAWHLGGFRVDQINEQWDWGADWDYNQRNNHAPGEALLNISRIPSAALLAAGVVVMFALGRALGGRWVAYLASLYYTLNPALLLDGRRAMMEGSLICFTLLTLLAGVWLLQKRRWWMAIVLGVAAGLALASKHTAVFTVAAVFGACGAYPVVAWVIARGNGEDAEQRSAPLQPHPRPLSIGEGRKIEPGKTGFGFIWAEVWHAMPLRVHRGAEADREEAWHAIPLPLYGMLAIAGVVALGVFYALNPAWWGDPVGRAAQVLDLRADLLAGQTAAFGGYANAGDALGGFFRQVFVNLPQYYEVPMWAGYIAEPLARYEGSIWRGVSVGGATAGGLALLALTVLGGWALVKSDRSSTTRWTVGGWALAMLITTALLTPVEWQRYYLPAYPAVGLLAACGLVWLAQRLQQRLQP